MAASYSRVPNRLAPMPPNVLLVVFDAARRDYLEPYGAPAGSSPTVAQLASRGTALPEVYATGCWTAPSHSSIFTGLMPRAAGMSLVPSPDVAKAAMDRHSERVLPEVFRRAGYSTFAMTANLWCSPASGFGTGFDRFDLVDPGRHAEIHRPGRRARLRWAAEGVRGKADHGARGAGETFDRWLPEVGDKPFFCFINLMEAHSPYLPPLPYGGWSLLRRFRVAEEARRYYTFEGIARTCAGALEMPAEVAERCRHMYRGGIRYMDDWLAARLETLQRTRRLDDTIVIVVADHGENLGETRFIAHALSLDNRLLHVPLVVAGPDAGASEINSLANLPRYIAERAGLSTHPWSDGPPGGYGVAQFDPPAVNGDEDAIRGFEAMGLAGEMDQFSTPLTCAVKGNLKLLRRGEREEFYDLAADPLEVAPLGADDVDGAAVEDLRRVLEHPSVTAATAAAEPSTSGASEEELRDLEERMRLLGYM
jgi:arylsulfatase A-like enzyme